MDSKKLTIIESEPSRMVRRSKRAAYYIAHSKAQNTLRTYRYAYQRYADWCAANHVVPIPADPEVVGEYLMDMAEQGLSYSTMRLTLTIISRANQMANYPPLSTREEPLHSIWEGIKRLHGTTQVGKAALYPQDLAQMIACMPSNLIGIRDRALLLLGFAGAFRRSELVALNVEDLHFSRNGVLVLLRKSKTDQYREGMVKAIPYTGNPTTCPVRAVQEWLKASGIRSGALFRYVNRHGQIPAQVRTKTGALRENRLSGHAVARIVKRWAAAAGLDPTRYSGHSLRVGLVTASAEAGENEAAIMRQTGHKSIAMVRRYTRFADLFTNNVVSKVGL